jgi:AcrR family transcriptional regulator
VAPAPRLTQVAIVDAAVEVLDTTGLDAFGMRAVADRLGTGVASLYRHVSGKPELLDLVLDRTLKELDVLRDGTWRVVLEHLARGLRTVLLDARDRARIALTSSTPTSSTAVIAETALSALTRQGVLPLDAVLIVDRLSAYVISDAAAVATMRERTTASDHDAHWTAMSEGYASIDADEFPVLAELGPLLAEPNEEERFEFGLALILDAVSARIALLARR